MPNHAFPTMAPKSGTVTSWAMWARICLGVWVVCGWCFTVGEGAAAIPSDITTEPYIYTGPTTTTPPPPLPPKDFDVSYNYVFASFVNLTISYNATYNLTKIIVTYKDPMDFSDHRITLRLGMGANEIDPYSLYDSNEARFGFKFKLGGLHRRKRYTIVFTGYQDTTRVVTYSVNFLTGDHNGEDNIYNLTGIFLVLGISTIIMVVVMVCVGYEKLIHQKSDECCSTMSCRRGKKKIPKSSISPEPLMINDGRGFDESSSSDSNHRY